jgi:hypothetical protein
VSPGSALVGEHLSNDIAGFLPAVTAFQRGINGQLKAMQVTEKRHIHIFAVNGHLGGRPRASSWLAQQL